MVWKISRRRLSCGAQQRLMDAYVISMTFFFMLELLLSQHTLSWLSTHPQFHFLLSLITCSYINSEIPKPEHAFFSACFVLSSSFLPHLIHFCHLFLSPPLSHSPPFVRIFDFSCSCWLFAFRSCQSRFTCTSIARKIELSKRLFSHLSFSVLRYAAIWLKASLHYTIEWGSKNDRDRREKK